MAHPYSDLPKSAFWKPAIAARSPFDIEGLWRPKFPIKPSDPVVTFGSCFAQHIGRALQARGYNWLITEKTPQKMPPDRAQDFGYGVFSCRTGNIYTTSLLEQWTAWAARKKPIPAEVWEENGHFVDPFRPRIEPNGFTSRDELELAREETVRAFRRAIKKARYFVFTLGLTESWFNAPSPPDPNSTYEYPMCPGTAGGDFDGTRHKFLNQPFNTVLKRLNNAIRIMTEMNPELRFILTVSPVPLTATASGNHVLCATMESKSVLRAVAGQLARNQANIDYFPSYEIINATPYQGMFFNPDKRTVNAHGVNHVMNQFFACQEAAFGPAVSKPAKPKAAQESAPADGKSEDDVVCEEALLAAFGDKS